MISLSAVTPVSPTLPLFQSLVNINLNIAKLKSNDEALNAYILTADQQDALAGTTGTPNASNLFVTETDPLMLTTDERDAITNAASPDASNPFATMDDIPNIVDDQIIKGWISFDGDNVGSPAVRDSYNVDSITDNGTGDWTVNWDTNFANANYCVVVSAEKNSGDTQSTIGLHETTPIAAGTTRLHSVNDNGSGNDANYVMVIAIGEV